MKKMHQSYSVTNNSAEYYQKMAMIMKEISESESFIVVDENRYSKIVECAKSPVNYCIDDFMNKPNI